MDEQRCPLCPDPDCDSRGERAAGCDHERIHVCTPVHDERSVPGDRQVGVPGHVPEILSRGHAEVVRHGRPDLRHAPGQRRGNHGLPQGYLRQVQAHGSQDVGRVRDAGQQAAPGGSRHQRAFLPRELGPWAHGTRLAGRNKAVRLRERQVVHQFHQPDRHEGLQLLGEDDSQQGGQRRQLVERGLVQGAGRRQGRNGGIRWMVPRVAPAELQGS